MKKGLIFALVLGAIGTGLFVWYLQHVEETQSGGVPIRVVVAATDIELGKYVRRRMVETKTIPESYLEERHIRYRDLNRVLGVRVVNRLHAGESILWSDLASQTYRQGDLSALIGVGMRAVTIRVRTVFGGLIRSGDRVDIVLTTLDRGRATDSIPLLQNVTVLALGSRITSDAPWSRRQQARRNEVYGEPVTVAVSVEQAGVLGHARTVGTLGLALRSPGDETIVQDLPRIETEDVLDADERERWQARERVAPIASDESEADEEGDGEEG